MICMSGPLQYRHHKIMQEYDFFHKYISALQHEFCKLKTEAFGNVIGTRYIILKIEYRKVASASPSCFEAHVGLLGLFRLLLKGIFDPYVL